MAGRIASDSILKGKSNARVFSPEARRSEGERRSGKRDTVRRVALHTIGDRKPSFQSFPPPHVRTASPVGWRSILLTGRSMLLPSRFFRGRRV